MHHLRIGLSIVLSLGLNICSAQGNCSFTLGEFYSAIRGIKIDTSEKLHYKAYSSFDFKNFLPIDGKLDKRNFFEIGYNGVNEIKEIIHYDSSWQTMKLNVFHGDKFKIMLMQYHIEDYGFMPVAFYISENVRFMVNFREMTGKNRFQFGALSDHPYIGPLEQISCIMILDEELYPRDYFIAHKGYIYLCSKINYIGNSKVIKDLKVELFFTPMEKRGRKIESSLKVCDLSYLFGGADSYMTVQPLNYKQGYPLWIYGGASWYK